MLGLGGHAETASHFANSEAALGPVIFGAELLQQLGDALAGLFCRFGNLIERQRFIGDVDDGFQHGEQLRVANVYCGGVGFGRILAKDFLGGKADGERFGPSAFSGRVS